MDTEVADVCAWEGLVERVLPAEGSVIAEELTDAWFESLATEVTEATLSNDVATLEGIGNGLRLGPQERDIVGAFDAGRISALREFARRARERLAAVEVSDTYEPDGIQMRMLRSVAVQPGTNSQDLAGTLGVHESVISKTGGRLASDGVLTSAKVGRFKSWMVTPRGRQILERFPDQTITRGLVPSEDRLDDILRVVAHQLTTTETLAETLGRNVAAARETHGQLTPPPVGRRVLKRATAVATRNKKVESIGILMEPGTRRHQGVLQVSDIVPKALTDAVFGNLSDIILRPLDPAQPEILSQFRNEASYPQGVMVTGCSEQRISILVNVHSDATAAPDRARRPNTK